MTKEVSRSFIEAMNGVLNGEKWRRKSWAEFECVRKYMDLVLRRYLSFESDEDFKRLYKDTSEMHYNDMTATDWERVE